MNIFIWKIAKYALIPLAMLAFSAVYKKFKKIPQDNFLEEFIERRIEKETGLDIDLSPDSKERNGDKK